MARSISAPHEDFATIASAQAQLLEFMTPEGLQASLDPDLQGAIFARDSIIVALDLLEWQPIIAQKVIISLARRQSRQLNNVTEAQPGKIMHEYRSRWLGGDEVSAAALRKLHELAAQWGGQNDELTYYGSADATPQYIRLIGRYCNLYGLAYLDHRFRHSDGTASTIRESVLAAAAWLTRQLQDSALGLLEFKRTNPRGHAFQTLRNDTTAFLHSDGQLANDRQPIAAVEVQAYAYDALQALQRLFPDHQAVELWETLAVQLRKATLDHFWLKDQQYFAMALDRNADGVVRPLTTYSSAPAELLDTDLFDGLPQAEAVAYLEPLVKRLMSDEFMTEVGLRMRGKSHYDLLPYWDYQGSRSSWAVITQLTARGLRRQGFTALAEDLEHRILQGVNQSRHYLELWYVDEAGRAAYEPFQPSTVPGAVIAAPLIPRAAQSWTVSAVLRILLQRQAPASSRPVPAGQSWQTDLTNDIINRIGIAKTSHIDVSAGRQLQADYLRHHQG